MPRTPDSQTPQDDPRPRTQDSANTALGRLCQQFVAQLGGRTHDRWSGYGVKESLIPCAAWTMVFRYGLFRSTDGNLEEGTTVFVRVQATNNLRFSVHPIGVLDQLKEVVGIHDIQIGEPTFDADYTVKSNQPEILRKLLQSPTILSAVRAAPYGRLSLGIGIITEDLAHLFRPRHGEEVLCYSPTATSLEGLLQRHTLLAHVLEELHALNAITRDIPTRENENP